MLARIVDAVFGHQHAVAAEIGHALTGHPEILDDTGDSFHGLVGREVKCGAAGIAVEDHVQVLVRGDAGKQPVGDRVTACLAGVAVADPGREFLEGDIRDRQQEVGLVTFLFLGCRCETVGHMGHARFLEGDRVDAAGHDEIVAQGDAVPALFGRPPSHPGSPRPVEREVVRRLAMVGGQVVLGQKVGDHGRPGDLTEL